jgi:ClpP class serine protease
MTTVEEQKALDARLIDHLGKNRDLVKAEQDLKDGANPDTQIGKRVTLLSRMAVDMPAFIMNDKRLNKSERKGELEILKQSIALLIQYDADVNFQNEDGKTILAQVRDGSGKCQPRWE